MFTLLLQAAPAADVGVGAFLASVRANWPLLVAAFGIIWYMAQLASSVKSLAKAVDKMTKEFGHKLDDHETRLSRIEGARGTP